MLLQSVGENLNPISPDRSQSFFSMETAFVENPRKNAFVLKAADKDVFCKIDEESLIPIYAIFDKIGAGASQVLVRTACEQKDEINKNETLPDRMARIMDSERMKSVFLLKKEVDEAVVVWKRSLSNSIKPGSFERLALLMKEGVDAQIDQIIEVIAGLRKGPEDRVSSVILGDSLKKVSGLYAETIELLLKREGADDQGIQAAKVDMMFDAYFSLMQKVTSKEFLKKSPLQRKQEAKLVPFFKRQVTKLMGMSTNMQPNPARLDGSSRLSLENIALAAGIITPERRPLESFQEVIDAMQSSLSAIVSHIAFKKGRGISVRHLPGDVKELCSVIEALDLNRTFEKDPETPHRPQLQDIMHQLNSADGTTDLKVIYELPFIKLGGQLIVSTAIKDGKALSLNLEGRIFELDKTSASSRKLNSLHLYLLDNSLAGRDEVVEYPGDVTFQFENGLIDFQFILSGEKFRESKENVQKLLETMVDYLQRGDPLPEFTSHDILKTSPQLIKSVLGGQSCEITLSICQSFFKGIKKNLSYENVACFLESYPRLISAVGVTYDRLHSIIDSLLVDKELLMNPRLIELLLKLLIRVHPKNPKNTGDDYRKELLEQKLEGRREAVQTFYKGYMKEYKSTQDEQLLEYFRKFSVLYMQTQQKSLRRSLSSRLSKSKLNS